MMCADFEEDIHLYRELTDTEKLRVDSHLQECATCRELFQLVSAAQHHIAQTAAVKPLPENEARLTRNIMQAIDDVSVKKQTVFNAFFESVFVKYSLAALSFALIVGFTFEFQSENRSTIPSHTATVTPAKTVTLNTTMLLQAVHEKTRAKQKEPRSLYACIKSESCDIVKNFKLKKSS